MKYGLLTLLTLVAGMAHAQVVTIDADDLSAQRVLTGETWRFQAGDSLAWAHPAYDDAHWDTTRSLLGLSDSLYLADWEGMGWFRLKFQVADTTMRHVLLNATGYGVAELFLDGQRVLSTGHISGEKPREIDESVLIAVYADSVHSLAIRYANTLLPPLVDRVLRYLPVGLSDYVAPGVSVEIVAPEAQKSVTASRYMLWLMTGLTIGVVGALAALGMLIYLKGIRDEALLYLALALVMLTLSSGSSFHLFMAPGNAWRLPFAVPFWVVSFKAFLLFLGLGMSAAFFPARRWLKKALGVIVVLVLASDFNEAFSPLSGTLATGMNVVFLGILGAIAFTAMWHKKPGSWTLGAGPLLFVAFIIVAWMSEWGWGNDYFALLIILLIPVSIGGLIVRRYAESIRSKLAAEKDRQRLIETQKERLEVEVTARTQELRESMQRLSETQAQLIQSEKLASLGSLTAGIAHEIKNPLNFVNNFAEVSRELVDELAEALGMGQDGDRTGADGVSAKEARAIMAVLRSNAEQIAKHGGRADDIVQSMMQHARGGSAARETVDINAFVGEYIDLAWHGIRAKDHAFDCEVERVFSDDAGTALLQPQDMGRVLLNLLNNAFYATRMEDSAPKAIVRVETGRSADGKSVTIHVADSGPGIPDAIRERIFEPFFTTKPTGEGTGLGLSLSHDIVAKGHGGSLTVQNAEDGGAEFIVTLPSH